MMNIEKILTRSEKILPEVDIGNLLQGAVAGLENMKDVPANVHLSINRDQLKRFEKSVQRGWLAKAVGFSPEKKVEYFAFCKAVDALVDYHAPRALHDAALDLERISEAAGLDFMGYANIKVKIASGLLDKSWGLSYTSPTNHVDKWEVIAVIAIYPPLTSNERTRLDRLGLCDVVLESDYKDGMTFLETPIGIIRPGNSVLGIQKTWMEEFDEEKVKGFISGVAEASLRSKVGLTSTGVWSKLGYRIDLSRGSSSVSGSREDGVSQFRIFVSCPYRGLSMDRKPLPTALELFYDSSGDDFPS